MWPVDRLAPRLPDQGVRSRVRFFWKQIRTDIANALAYRLTNARVESLNTKIRLLIRRAYASAALKPSEP